ncbi:phage neck terminator protein [Solilutibacter silvestris]|uniref:phage neck terminator protein n=1 Tax=Solilutibacter silvestris TaxID=1645665 RepID=UPI003D3439F9
MADSSAAGYLSPTTTAIEDDALDNVLHDAISAISGLPGNMVRPRWQPTVPKMPEQSTNWCAFGVKETHADEYPAESHDPTGTGTSTLQRHIEFDVFLSFYGTNAMSFASTLRDGLFVAQNRDVLMANGINLISVDRIITAPDLVNQQWIHRYDLTLHCKRREDRTYPVLNILSAPIAVTSSH